MADSVSPKVRSRIMAAVKQRDTKPELIVRSVLHRLGYRFRLNRKDLPGSPDITLPRFHSAIFVHGCFWHQHPKCDKARKPKSNTKYWNQKFSENVDRDKRNIQELKRENWKVLVVWECETKKLNLLAKRLNKFLK